MIYGSKKSLEDRIVEILAKNDASMTSLHQILIEEKESVSLRAIYKSVHGLIDAGVVLKFGKRITLNQEWTRRVGETLGSVSIPNFSIKERAIYIFTSFEHLDAFWKVVLPPLEHAHASREVFFYSPHNFWVYLPECRQSTDTFYRHLSETSRHGFFTVGGNSVADAEFKEKHQHKHLQIDLREVTSFRRTDHITIIGSILITIQLPKGITRQIDEIYASGENMEDILPKIIRACHKPGKIRFMIENNPKKAERLRKALARGFYFKWTE